MMEHVASHYCFQRYDNPLMREIRLLYHTDVDGKGDCCEIFFNDGTSAIHKLNNEAVYTRQYGVPLSADGATMYIGDWYKGLTAYDTVSGKELWRIRRPHIRMTHLFSDFGVTIQSNKELIQFDSQTGVIRSTIKGQEINEMFFLKDELILIYRYLGSACMIDSRSMTVEKRIPPSVLDPHECLSLILLDAYVKDDKVIAVGWESGARTEARYKPKHNFERVLATIG